jgi:hypothetical protein
MLVVCRQAGVVFETKVPTEKTGVIPFNQLCIERRRLQSPPELSLLR